jgi:hypothetical protein
MKIFNRKYYFQGLVYFDENHNLTICGIYVKWLDQITILAFTRKKAEKQAFNFFNEKYPEYKDFVQLY